MGWTRRKTLGALAGIAAVPALARLSPTARAEAPPKPAKAPAWRDFEVRDLTVEGEPGIATRLTLLVPKHLSSKQRVPLLILLHGLGEAHDQSLGAHAWIDRYGLGTAYERLRRPPVARTLERPYWTDPRLGEINTALEKRPFQGMVIACPFTPRVSKSPLGSAVALDRYADWIEDVLIPRARREAPVIADGAPTSIDGCSMGGYIAIEVFVRKPGRFRALGMVQSAFGPHRVPGYADRIASAMSSHGEKPISIITSSGDPFREANRALGAALTDKGLRVTARESPGPHDQPWLRETGTLEMLLWHDRLT